MLLFLDECGTDHTVMPYEIIGGIAIRERDLWNYVQAVGDAQRRCFGGLVRELSPRWEIKGRTILAREKFRQAQRAVFTTAERSAMAERFLVDTNAGRRPTRDGLTAFAQSCLLYVEELLDAAVRFDVRVFAAIVDAAAPQPACSEVLRRDYAFLFERYFYYLEEEGGETRGLIVFDELEKSQCRRTLRRLDDYFGRTRTGRERSERIIPEPFFVHSDLTTGTQTADIIIYILNWAYRFGQMTGETRDELKPLAEKIRSMVAHLRGANGAGGMWDAWSVLYLDDLRPQNERC
jgi:hypothetical protein